MWVNVSTQIKNFRFLSATLLTMRDLASKMAELKFEAPLAQFEEADDWSASDYPNNGSTTTSIKLNEVDNINHLNNKRNKDINDVLLNDFNEDALLNDNMEILPGAHTLSLGKNKVAENGPNNVSDNFTETFSGSLEDLVNTFDDKITKCFGNYEESVEKLAPVQVRTQEEIMNECQ